MTLDNLEKEYIKNTVTLDWYPSLTMFLYDRHSKKPLDPSDIDFIMFTITISTPMIKTYFLEYYKLLELGQFVTKDSSDEHLRLVHLKLIFNGVRTNFYKKYKLTPPTPI